MRFLSRLILLFSFGLFFPTYVFGAETLYSVDAFSSSFSELDQDTYDTLSTLALADGDSGTISGFNGVAVHPTTGVVYVIARVGSARYLATVDVENAVVSRIGNLGDNFAAIAFDDDGTLYGLTGDGASTASSLFSIDPSDASKTLLASYASDNDGEALASDPDDGLLYRATGDDVYAIDPNDPTNPTMIFEDNADLPDGCATALFHESGAYFLWACSSDVYSLNMSSGEGIHLAAIDESSKGFFRFSPAPSVESVVPADGSFNVSVVSTFSLTFDRNVYQGSGNITLKKVSDNSTVHAIAVGSPHITGWGGETLTISFPSPLDWETEYAIQIDATAVKDGDDKYYAGISGLTAWSFRTRPDGNGFSFSDSFANRDFIDEAETDAVYDGMEDSYSLDYLGWSNMIGSTSGYDVVADMGVSLWDPKIILDVSEKPILMWRSTSVGSANVHLSRWDGSGWTSMDGLSDYDSFLSGATNSYDHEIILGPDGNPIVIWDDDSSGAYEVYLTRWDGSQWVKMDGTSGYENMSNSPQNAFWGQFAFDPSGNLIVAWSARIAGNWDIYLTRWDGSQWVKMDGSPGRDNVSSSVGISSSPVLKLDSSGRPFVVWQDNTNGTYNIYFSRWDGGAWVRMDGTGGNEMISNTARFSAGGARLVLDSSDDPIVIWQDYELGNREVYLTRWAGSAWTHMDGTLGSENVTNTSGDSYSYDILLDSSDNPLILWGNNASGSDRLYLTRWDGSQWAKMDGAPGRDDISDTDSSWPIHAITDNSGHPVIGWSKSGMVHVTRWDGSQWAKMDGTLGRDNVIPAAAGSNMIRDTLGDPFVVGVDSNVYFSRWVDDHISPATAQSANITGLLSRNILAATLSADDDTPGASRIEYFLSNNGGVDWTETESGERVTFSTSGKDLRWKAVLFSGSVPTLFSVSVSYASAGDPASSDMRALLNLDINSTISLACDPSVTMNALVGTGKSTINNNNQADCTIITNSSSGYKMQWQASTDDMINAQNDHFAAYSPSASTTPEMWNVSNTTSGWGAKLGASSEGYNGGSGGSGYSYPAAGWGSDDSYVLGKFLNVASASPFQIMQKSTETDVDGEIQSLMFAAEIGADKLQPTGTYAVDVTVTATTL